MWKVNGSTIRYPISGRLVKPITIRISDIVRRAWRNQAGFTLVEVIVMAAVATVGLLSILLVATSALRTSDSNENRVAATNLAREGVELVRAARDSNWAAQARQRQAGVAASNLQAWNCYATPGHEQDITVPTLKPYCDTVRFGDGTLNYVAYPNVGNGVPSFLANTAGTPTQTKQNAYLICSGSNGVYVPTAAAAGGNPCPGGGTPFYRRILVKRGKDLPGGTFNILVQSFVTWPDNKGSDVSVEEYLTDWRKF